MNFEDSPAEAEFRSELRAWLRENAPPGPYPSNQGAEGNAFAMEWHRTLYKGGWLGVSWPEEFGGRGLSAVYEAIVNEEVGRAGVPQVPSIGYLGRSILEYGTTEQRRDLLPPFLRGDVQWCQGFSEPDAGSDLASLSTRADRDGDHYVVNGQKVWTSRANWADWCLLLCRTDQDASKHKGLSCLAVRMDTPGITVRPLRQIWGTAEFNEVFFDDVRVPVAQRIGEEGDGWRLATVVLAHERGPADIGSISKLEQQIALLDRRLASTEDEGDRAALARSIAEASVELAACRHHVVKSLSMRSRGIPPGPESSVDKLLMTRAAQTLGALLLGTGGPDVLLGDDEHTAFLYMFSRAASVYGGTEQIQRNIIAQRILGLPNADKGARR